MSDAEAILRHYKDFTVLSEQVPCPLLFLFVPQLPTFPCPNAQIRAEESTLLQSSSDMRTVEDVDREYSTLKEKRYARPRTADDSRPHLINREPTAKSFSRLPNERRRSSRRDRTTFVAWSRVCSSSRTSSFSPRAAMTPSRCCRGTWLKSRTAARRSSRRFGYGLCLCSPRPRVGVADRLTNGHFN